MGLFVIAGAVLVYIGLLVRQNARSFVQEVANAVVATFRNEPSAPQPEINTSKSEPPPVYEKKPASAPSPTPRPSKGHPFDPQLSSGQSRIVVSQIVVGPPGSAEPSSFLSNNFFLNVEFANIGKMPANGVAHQMVTTVYDRPMTEEEINVSQNQATDFDATDLAKLSQASEQELMPGDPQRHFFTMPNRPGADVERLTREYQNVIAGKKRLYIFISFIFRDIAMAKDVVGVSEYGAYFTRTFTVSHQCGRNRAFLRQISATGFSAFPAKEAH